MCRFYNFHLSTPINSFVDYRLTSKKEMKKSPRFYKTIKANKAPIILDKSLGMETDPYKKIGKNLLNKLAIYSILIFFEKSS